MDAGWTLKTLNATTPLPLSFCSRASILRPFFLSQVQKQFCSSLSLSQRSSPLPSLYERGNENSLPHGVGEGLGESSRNKPLRVVLVSPQEFSYRKGDYLVSGSETSGLPPEALQDCKGEIFGGGTIRIPMVETYVRCLYLSVSVGIALYEASRQLNYEQLQFPTETLSMANSRLSRRIFLLDFNIFDWLRV